jgi:hypothetical protein
MRRTADDVTMTYASSDGAWLRIGPWRASNGSDMGADPLAGPESATTGGF